MSQVAKKIPQASVKIPSTLSSGQLHKTYFSSKCTILQVNPGIIMQIAILRLPWPPVQCYWILLQFSIKW